MNGIFVDTAGWMACADEGDPAHARARESRDVALEQGNILVTTDYVIDETLTLVRVRLGLAASNTWWEPGHPWGPETPSRGPLDRG